ncbi:MAG: selenide, water dikinase SelD [Oligoflexia bacterium]|nr:selenide, water dikinase SelD [Oligoflexia bacterium]
MLRQAVKNIPKSTDPNLLVGFENADDAGVYRLSKNQALVQTVDFFTPIVDDPTWFGRIAAANSLSDIYAMGAQPLTALNIFCAPEDLPPATISKILSGGAEKLREAGCVLVGGHSVKDRELKFGMSITGMVHPKKYLSNDMVKVGDVLVLTKPLGTGVITTAAKNDSCPPEVLKKAVLSMARLNRKAGELMIKHGAHACTDITGFGLMGHLSELARASHVKIRIQTGQIPRFAGVEKLIEQEFYTRGDQLNRDYAKPFHIAERVSQTDQHLIFDPQTSGGLLICIPPKKCLGFIRAMTKAGELATPIGTVLKKQKHGLIEVVP